MNTDIENQLMAGMRHEVAGIALTTDIVGEATRAHRRRIAVQRSAYAAGILGLAGTLAAVVAVGGTSAGGGGEAGTGRPPVASAESPSLQLVAAVTASENISYKLKVTAGDKNNPGSWETAEGAFDPKTSTGYLDSRQPGSDAVFHQRLIDGVLFIGSSGAKKWKQEPSDGRLEYADAPGAVVGSSADPDQLFEALRAEQATITQTGARTYHFESTKAYDNQYATGSVILAGDVTLDADKRIAKVTYESTNKGQMKPGVKGGVAFDSSYVVTLELSDYGTPVQVQRPTDVVVAK